MVLLCAGGMIAIVDLFKKLTGRAIAKAAVLTLEQKAQAEKAEKEGARGDVKKGVRETTVKGAGSGRQPSNGSAKSKKKK